MTPIIDYKIVRQYSVTTFETEIKHLVSEGWQPLGAPLETNSGLMQAMVLYQHPKSLNLL